MKWMMSSVAMLIAVVLSVTARAQSGGTMPRGDKMDKMEMKDRRTPAASKPAARRGLSC